ncbi:MAG: hypothetical protein AW10_03962 [Candidatus Accumulibacter appositus]|uniref:Uncharacterized protein n=1 Tax=Candidatus Accumulibacter appositus TaxID=1454003 RepID=A0A011NPE9_9PROT|nr:MAG: hypothetical protein AW10_03962 [Candidatus Accumulibacter appositus]
MVLYPSWLRWPEDSSFQRFPAAFAAAWQRLPTALGTCPDGKGSLPKRTLSVL